MQVAFSPLFFIAFLCLFASCSLFYPEKGNIKRGSLSEAMKKSSDDYKGERKVSDSRKEERRGGDDGGLHVYITQVSDSDTMHSSRRKANPAQAGKHYAGLQVSSGLLGARHYSSESGISALWAFQYAQRTRHSLALELGFIPMNASNDLFKSIGDILQLDLGYQFRRYTTPDFTFMGFFYLFGVDLKSMFWNYKNPIASDVVTDAGDYLYTDTVKSDGLWGFSVNTGLGVSLVQTSFFRLSATGIVGGTFYSNETHQKFRNDVFKGDFFAKMALDAVFRIR